MKKKLLVAALAGVAVVGVLATRRKMRQHGHQESFPVPTLPEDEVERMIQFAECTPEVAEQLPRPRIRLVVSNS